MAFDHKDQTSDYGSAFCGDSDYGSAFSGDPAQLGRVVIGNPPDINIKSYKQPPPRAHVRFDIKEISNGWLLCSLTSDRAMDFEGDRYYKDIGTLLADLERRLIDAGYKESGHDE